MTPLILHHRTAVRSLAGAALLAGAPLGLAAQTVQQPDRAPDPLADQTTAPPSPRVHLTEGDLLEPMSPADYVPPTRFESPWPTAHEPGASKPGAAEDPGFAAGTDIDAVLSEPLHAPDGAGGYWVRTRRLKTHFEADAVTTYPTFGPASPRNWPVRLSLESATLAGEALELNRGGAPAMAGDGGRVEIDRGALTEAWNLHADQIEQTFVFDELPGAGGDLVVRVAVETDLAASEVGGEIVFEHPDLGGVTYGAAVVLDAAGRRSAIERSFDGEAITLTVPASFLAGATLPVTIDPPLTAFGNSFGTADDLTVDVCYAGNPGVYYVTWEDYTSATDSDVYISSFTSGGTQGVTRLLDGSTEWWGTPSIGYLGGHDRLLIASSVSPNGPGNFPSQIRGFIYDPVAESFTELDFPISSSGTEKQDPVVGGTNADLTSNNHFLVAWSRILAPDRWSIEYRVIDFDASGVTGITVVDDTTGRRNRQPAVSASHGDADLFGDYWTLAWNENSASSFFGFGKIKARRVVFSGNTILGGGNFTVNNSTRCANPSVSSRFDEAYGASTDRPSLVAYSIHDFSNGLRGDIVVNAVTAGASGPSNLVTIMEDFDDDLNQITPAIASDGRAFILAYSEIFYGNPTGSDLDVYMCSGTIAEDGSSVRIGLSERHENLAFTASPERSPSIVMLQDGNNQLTSDDGLVGWLREISATANELRFYTVDAATTDILFSRNAVGRQYCDANEHSGTPAHFRPAASWLWIEGNQVAGASHRMNCKEMPDNVFSLLLCSRQTGNVNLAGGVGRLCLGGSIGRFNSLLANSGANGAITFNVDTSAMPQGVSLVSAQPGETWHFQVWHRDFTLTSATSNYSNAASVTFTP